LQKCCADFAALIVSAIVARVVISQTRIGYGESTRATSRRHTSIVRPHRSRALVTDRLAS
jgi:hypothetical protein